MAECLIGFSHTVGVFTLLYSSATIVDRVHQFVGQALLHRVLTALAGGIDQPPDRQSLTALSAHFNRHLIGSTTNTT
ncbi:hemagglutinin 2 [Gluconobacter frateurii NBRC 103465]|nr:hemagglutinin 2 [Gluconobacter frateurii NBRC 103465]